MRRMSRSVHGRRRTHARSRSLLLLALCGHLLLSAFDAGEAAALGTGAPIDVNRFHPATGTGKLLTLDLADVGPNLELVPQLILHYADRPLDYTQGGVVQSHLVA